ncbi:9344_t:CDS:1, partial [Gigaspora rosea]
MKFSVAQPENLGFHYLNLFKEEVWEEVAEFAGANPSAQDVCSATLHRTESLATHKIKPTKIDVAKTFDIEAEKYYDEIII